MQVDYKDIKNAPIVRILTVTGGANGSVINHDLNTTDLFVITNNPQWAAMPYTNNQIKLTGPSDEVFNGKISITKES